MLEGWFMISECPSFEADLHGNSQDGLPKEINCYQHYMSASAMRCFLIKQILRMGANNLAWPINDIQGSMPCRSWEPQSDEHSSIHGTIHQGFWNPVEHLIASCAGATRLVVLPVPTASKSTTLHFMSCTALNYLTIIVATMKKGI